MAESAGSPIPKLTDFGISSLVDTERARSTTLVGTPQYIAPEVSEGHEATAASDLYALGITLYELACGVTPFAGGSVLAVLRRHSDVAPARPDSMPDELWDLIAWLLNKQPGQRPPSARQVATILDALGPALSNYPPGRVLDEPPLPEPSAQSQETVGIPFIKDPTTSVLPRMDTDMPAPPPPHETLHVEEAARPKRRRRGLLVAGIAGVLVVLAVGGFTAVNAFNAGNLLATGKESGVASPTSAPASPTSTSSQGTAVATASSAPAKAGMPDVVGKLLPDAQKALGSGVNIQVVDKFDNSKPDGTVLAQAPVSGSTSRVELTVARSEVISYLSDQKPVSGSWTDSSSAVTISGATHAHSVSTTICNYGSGSAVEYNLGRNYQTFTATAGLEDSSEDSAAVALVEVFADGRKVSSQSVVYGQPVTISADMSDVLRMKIQWQDTTCGKSGYATLAFGGARVLGLPGRVPVPTPTP
jgi:serine/threonine-protein kinase